MPEHAQNKFKFVYYKGLCWTTLLYFIYLLLFLLFFFFLQKWPRAAPYFKDTKWRGFFFHKTWYNFETLPQVINQIIINIHLLCHFYSLYWRQQQWSYLVIIYCRVFVLDESKTRETWISFWSVLYRWFYKHYCSNQEIHNIELS